MSDLTSPISIQQTGVDSLGSTTSTPQENTLVQISPKQDASLPKAHMLEITMPSNSPLAELSPLSSEHSSVEAQKIDSPPPSLLKAEARLASLKQEKVTATAEKDIFRSSFTLGSGNVRVAYDQYISKIDEYIEALNTDPTAVDLKKLETEILAKQTKVVEAARNFISDSYGVDAITGCKFSNDKGIPKDFTTDNKADIYKQSESTINRLFGLYEAKLEDFKSDIEGFCTDPRTHSEEEYHYVINAVSDSRVQGNEPNEFWEKVIADPSILSGNLLSTSMIVSNHNQMGHQTPFSFSGFILNAEQEGFSKCAFQATSGVEHDLYLNTPIAAYHSLDQKFELMRNYGSVEELGDAAAKKESLLQEMDKSSLTPNATEVRVSSSGVCDTVVDVLTPISEDFIAINAQKRSMAAENYDEKINELDFSEELLESQSKHKHNEIAVMGTSADGSFEVKPSGIFIVVQEDFDITAFLAKQDSGVEITPEDIDVRRMDITQEIKDEQEVADIAVNVPGVSDERVADLIKTAAKLDIPIIPLKIGAFKPISESFKY